MMPLTVADSEEFKALPWGAQKFLFDLYVVFHDCERFTIDISKPEMYRQTKGVWLPMRIRTLIDAGLLRIVDYQKKKDGHRCRVFSFPQPPDCQGAIAPSGQTIQPLHP